jgi:hypothetical protein
MAREKGCDLSHLIEETLRDRIAPTQPVVLEPFTPEESRRCFATPDPEFGALAMHCAALAVPEAEQAQGRWDGSGVCFSVAQDT